MSRRRGVQERVSGRGICNFFFSGVAPGPSAQYKVSRIQNENISEDVEKYDDLVLTCVVQAPQVYMEVCTHCFTTWVTVMSIVMSVLLMVPPERLWIQMFVTTRCEEMHAILLDSGADASIFPPSLAGKKALQQVVPLESFTVLRVLGFVPSPSRTWRYALEIFQVGTSCCEKGLQAQVESASQFVCFGHLRVCCGVFGALRLGVIRCIAGLWWVSSVWSGRSDNLYGRGVICTTDLIASFESMSQ